MEIIFFSFFVCYFKNLAFLCSAKTEKQRLNEANEVLEKKSEKIWRLKKMIYFCSPKIREQNKLARSSRG